MPETELLELLSILCLDGKARLILGHLRQNGWLEWRTTHWFAPIRLMDMGGKGRVHSNIPNLQAYKVIDVDSGKEIGIIAGMFDKTFVLAQKTWKVVSVGEFIISTSFGVFFYGYIKFMDYLHYKLPPQNNLL